MLCIHLWWRAWFHCILRSFLRLGDPLSCTINDITIQQLQTEAIRTGLIDDPVNPSSYEQTNPEPEPAKQESSSGTGKSNSDSEYLKKKSDLILPCGKSESEKLAEDGEKEVKTSDVGVDQKRKYGGSLSLARIQSLVSMTTPRASNMSNVLGSPMFIEIDHSIDGFGCLFLPSVFPQQIALSQQLQGDPCGVYICMWYQCGVTCGDIHLPWCERF